MPDRDFDQLFPASHRHRSGTHWTPVDVALRVGVWLGSSPGGQVLDVGSGVGKLCLIGALTSDARWTGIERDGSMVRAAERAARSLDVADRTCFLKGEASAVDWSQFGGFYLYNPFAESLFLSGRSDRVGARAFYAAALALVDERLDRAGAGTRVATYHGYGGELPGGFELIERVPAHRDELCLWVRR